MERERSNRRYSERVRTWIIILLVCSLLCAGGASLDAAGTVSDLKIGASSAGGTYYVWGAGLVDVLMKKLNVQGYLIVTGGSQANIPMVNDRKTDIGFSTDDLLQQAYLGTGWADKRHSNIRLLWALQSNPYHIYTLENSQVKSLHDLAGRVVATGILGSSHAMNTTVLLDFLEETQGIKVQKVMNAKTSDMNNLLRDGMADAAIMTAAVPVGNVIDIASTHRIRLIPMSSEIANEFCRRYPAWVPCRIPGQAYGVSEDASSVAVYSAAIVNKDVNEALVYEMTKAVHENRDIIALHFQGDFSPPDHITRLHIPLHLGALRYYREIGVELPGELVPPEINK